MPAALPMKNDNNGKTTPPIFALVLAADKGGKK